MSAACSWLDDDPYQEAHGGLSSLPAERLLQVEEEVVLELSLT